MNIFEEAVKVLKSKVQVRKLFQDMHSEDVKRIAARLEAIYEEKKLAQQEGGGKQLLMQQRVFLRGVLRQLKEQGVSMDALQDFASGTGRGRGNTKPRQKFIFRYETVNGEPVNWQGATTGRIPGSFMEYLDRTQKSRKDCIVEEISR